MRRLVAAARALTGKLWPRSLRTRLVLVLIVAMLVTQAIVIVAVAQLFGREQRIERAQQMARFVSFIKPRVEALGEVKLDEPLNLRPGRPRMPPPEFRSAPGDHSIPPHKPPPDGAERTRTGSFSPRERIEISVTAKPPPGTGDLELLAVMRGAVPETVAILYEDTTPWPQVGPRRAYEVTTWVELSPGRYMKARLDESRTNVLSTDNRVFPILDIGLRISVGIALALLITGWIAKPLTELADSADATLPNGELKPGARRLSIHEVPTEIANTLAAFERMRLRIGSMVQERTTMLTALAHDIRTPITRLMLRLELANDPKLRDEAYRDCEKMQELITRTLDFIRSTSEGTQGSEVLVDVDAALAQVVAVLPPVDQARVRFAQPRHAQEPPPRLVRGNALGIERALANVIENGLKYGGADGVEIAVENAAPVNGTAQLAVSVRDRGPGVPPDTLNRLREPFYRVDGARNLDEGGAGLGLSIADNLMRAYGGEMEITNRDGGGLAVTLKLPLA
jgi:signal transduction histidine kinase